jgi:hypothetical protein
MRYGGERERCHGLQICWTLRRGRFPGMACSWTEGKSCWLLNAPDAN